MRFQGFRLYHMKRAGFGLIETLITLALSAFFIAATGQLILHGMRVKQKSEAGLTTAQHAAALAESFRALPFSDPSLEAGDHEDKVEDALTHCVFVRQWTVEDAAPGIKDISVSASCENRRSAPIRMFLRLDQGLGF